MILVPLLGSSSAPAPDGCTFFGERQRAFVRVLAVQQVGCVLGLALERLSVIEALRLAEDLLDSRQCERGVGSDALSELPRTGQCGPRCGQLAHEPVLLGIDGRKRRSEEHTSELQSQFHLVCRLLLEKKNKKIYLITS